MRVSLYSSHNKCKNLENKFLKCFSAFPNKQVALLSRRLNVNTQKHAIWRAHTHTFNRLIGRRVYYTLCIQKEELID